MKRAVDGYFRGCTKVIHPGGGAGHRAYCRPDDMVLRAGVGSLPLAGAMQLFEQVRGFGECPPEGARLLGVPGRRVGHHVGAVLGAGDVGVTLPLVHFRP